MSLIEIVVVLVVIAVVATTVGVAGTRVVNRARIRSASTTATTAAREADALRLTGHPDPAAGVADDLPDAHAGVRAPPGGTSVVNLDGGTRVGVAVPTGVGSKVAYALLDTDGTVTSCVGEITGGRIWGGDAVACTGGPRPLPTSTLDSDSFGDPVGKSVFTVGDVTGDGIDDLAWIVLSGGVSGIRVLAGGPSMVLDPAAATFTVLFPSMGNLGLHSTLRVADLDGDGDGDLVASWSASGNRTVVVPVDPSWSGTVNDPAGVRVFTSTRGATEVTDLTGDGIPDLLLVGVTDPPGRTKAGKVHLIPGPMGSWPANVDVTASTIDGEYWGIDNTQALDAAWWEITTTTAPPAP